MKKRKTKPRKPAAAPTPEHPETAPASAGPQAADSARRVAAVPPGRPPMAAKPAGAAYDETEPTVRTGAPLPVVLIVIFGTLLYLGHLYLMNASGQWDPRVYYPYRSVAQLEALQPKSDADEMYAEGRRVYNYICVQCHQANGQGNPALFIPPLAESEWVLAEEPGRLIRIIYKGLTGPIQVRGATYGQAAMFGVGDQLPGDEEAKARQVAAVLTYIRNTWGNQAPPVSIERVQEVHAKFTDRTEPWTAEELLAIPESE